MPQINDVARRARLTRRHRLAGDAASPEEAAESVVVLHATDPATVYLAVLARSKATTLDEIAASMYERRTLLRLLGMRRTLFVVPATLVPTFHAGAGLEIEARIRRRILSELTRIPTEPPVPADPATLAVWLEEVEGEVNDALLRLGSATGAQLSAVVPRLRTALLPTTDKAYDVKRNITSQVLTMMAAGGAMVRTEPRGEWTSRHHTWQSVEAWWPHGWPELEPTTARSDLLAAYLRAFGPATEVDLVWWTGWNQRQTRAALAGLPTVEVGVGSGTALVLADDLEDDLDDDPPEPVATLLPALDSTPMGWKERAWFLPPDPKPLYDAFGNIGPTIWWDGEVVGGWAITASGDIATELLVDRGQAAVAAVEAVADRLWARTAGARVTPTFPTPLERRLRTG